MRDCLGWLLVLMACLLSVGGCSRPAPVMTEEVARAQDPKHSVEMLKSKNAGDRRLAARRLGRMGANAQFAIPELQRVAQKDKDPSVRTLAEQALRQLQGTK